MKNWPLWVVVGVLGSAVIAKGEDNGGEASSPRITMQVFGMEGIASSKDKWPSHIALSNVTQNVSWNDMAADGKTAAANPYLNLVTVTAQKMTVVISKGNSQSSVTLQKASATR